MKESKFLSVNTRDILKGLLMAILTPAVLIIQNSLEAGSLVFNWRNIGIAAISGGVAYLIKNFFTHPTVEIKNDEPQA
mgnify:CR=1 FL=1|jgi:hypothetical protein